jgi:hypothetical protein
LLTIEGMCIPSECFEEKNLYTDTNNSTTSVSIAPHVQGDANDVAIEWAGKC